MAKLQGPIFSIDAHGTIGGALTYSKRAIVKQARFQRKQKDKTTAARAAIREKIKNANSDWHVLGKEIASTYDILAKGKSLSGYNIFIKKYIKGFFSKQGKTWENIGNQYGEENIWSLCYLGNGICLAGTNWDGYILRSICE